MSCDLLLSDTSESSLKAAISFYTADMNQSLITLIPFYQLMSLGYLIHHADCQRVRLPSCGDHPGTQLQNQKTDMHDMHLFLEQIRIFSYRICSESRHQFFEALVLVFESV